MNNKKGISAIVATVLIILITVAAVTIIWAAIIPMITENIGGATECVTPSAALTVVSDYSCFRVAGDDVCSGTATSCSGLAEVACGTQAGCTWGTSCSGTATACSGLAKGACGTQAGCTWGTSSDAQLEVQVALASGDFKLEGVDIIGSFEGSSKTVKRTDVPDANGAKVYKIDVVDGFIWGLDCLDEFYCISITSPSNTSLFLTSSQ